MAVAVVLALLPSVLPHLASWIFFTLAVIAAVISGVLILKNELLLKTSSKMKREDEIEQNKERKLKFDLGKFLLGAKEILLALEKMDAKLDSSGYVSAELKFEIWDKDVSQTLQNTDYAQLWFENKDTLDYRTAKKSDYIRACKYELGRLEYIKQLIFDKEGSQT
jgi:hypothetical protein